MKCLCLHVYISGHSFVLQLIAPPRLFQWNRKFLYTKACAKKTKTSDLLPKGHNERWLYKIVNPLNQWWTKSLSVHETWVCIQWIVYLLKSKFSVLHHMLSHYISIKSVSWLLVTFTNVFQFGNILKCLSSCLFPPKHVFIFYLLCIICFVYKLVSIKSIS